MFWTLRKVLLFFVGSATLTLTLFIFSRSLFTESKEKRVQDPQYLITALIQTGPEKEALQTAYLAEILGISADHPTNLYAFDIKQGEKKLKSSPLIASAQIKRMPPNALYIDYEARKPVALLGDYSNVAIDKQGHLFPVVPFFSPKELPEIYLGLPVFGGTEDSFERKGGRWDIPLSGKYLSLAFEVLDFLEGSPWREGLRIKKIDVSSAFAPSLGQREIVLFTEEELVLNAKGKSTCCVFPKMLRLSPKDYAAQMLNFLSLRKKMMEDYSKQIEGAALPESGRFSFRIIDLRIPHLAFVEN